MAKKRKRNLRLNYLKKRAIMDALVPLIARAEGLSYRLIGLGPEYFDPKQKIEAFRTRLWALTRP